MKTIKTYECDKCGLKFEDYEKAERHEDVCTNKHALYRRNVIQACDEALDKYGSLIKTINFKVDEDLDYYEYRCGGFSKLYKFEIEAILENGNAIGINDGFSENLPLGNYIEKDDIFKELCKEIENHIPTEYVGQLKYDPDDGWTRYTIDGVDVMDISHRLCGQYVTFHVIK